MRADQLTEPGYYWMFRHGIDGPPVIVQFNRSGWGPALSINGVTRMVQDVRDVQLIGPITYPPQADAELQRKIDALEALRPVWAQGHTDASITAQTQSAALAQIWSALGVENQTGAMQRLRALCTASECVAAWLSAALDDPKSCAEFKADIEVFLEVLRTLPETRT